MTSKTRLSNKVQITNIMRRLKPDYYLYVIFAREEVRSILSNPFSKKKEPHYKYLISQSNRKYIYEIMRDYTKINSPDDMYRVLFDFNSYVQINYSADVGNLNNALSVLAQYEAAKYSSFTTNKWDIRIDMSSKNLKNHASDMKEVTNSDTDFKTKISTPRSKYKLTNSLMSLQSLYILQKNFRGEIISRGGFEMFILKGNEETSEYTNSGNDQEVVFRHQRIEPINPEILKVFVPEDSPYKGLSEDLKLNIFDDDILYDVEKGKKHDNISVVIYKYFLYHVASNMKKGETSLVQQQQLGGEKTNIRTETLSNPELDNLGEVSQPNDADSLTFDNATPMDSGKLGVELVELEDREKAKDVDTDPPSIDSVAPEIPEKSNNEVDTLGEIEKPTDTDSLNFDSVSPETSEKIPENQEVDQQAIVVAKQVQRTEPFLHYEWLSIYARVKEAMDNGLSMEDAVSKEDEIISKKLKEVYPYKYSQFKDITDEEKRNEELSKQEQSYFDTYGEFFKAHATMRTLNLQILLSY